MDALTLDLIATLLASAAAIGATGLAVWFLPWSEKDWEPPPRPARAPRSPPAGRDPSARVAHVSVVP